QSADAAEKGWKGLLSISELSGDFAKRYGAITARHVMDYMVADANNPSSIRSCLMAARENARAVRGTLTTEVWETQNQTWLEFQRMVATGAFQKDPGTAFEWVKFRSHLSRGVTVGTMLQDEAFHFLRIGSFLERADNTARLLDVKFHSVEHDFSGNGPGAIGARMRNGLAAALGAGQSQAQSQSGNGSQTQSQSQTGNGSQSQSQSQESGSKDVEFDFYHWSAVLRSVSGFEVY